MRRSGCFSRLPRCGSTQGQWRPTFARSLGPRYTALRRDLRQYLRYHNFVRGHTGRHNRGRPPAELVYGARKVHPR